MPVKHTHTLVYLSTSIYARNIVIPNKACKWHFQNSLKNGLVAQQTDLKQFDAILNLQKNSKKFRPTLFDFLSHNALEFYKTSETSITQASYKFEVDKNDFERFYKLQNNYYRKPALQPTMPWLVQYEVVAPIVNKKDAQSYSVEVIDVKKVKQFAILSKTNNAYAVEAIVSGATKQIDFKKLSISKQADTQYFLVAIGLQNQLSKMIAL